MKTLQRWLRQQIDRQYRLLLDECKADDLETPYTACMCIGVSLAKAVLTEDA